MNSPGTRSLAALVAIGLILGACISCAYVPGLGADSPGVTSSPFRLHNLTPEQYGKLGAFIHQNPHQADRILRANDLSRAEFESAIRFIASDVKRAKRYQQSFQKALREGKEAPS